MLYLIFLSQSIFYRIFFVIFQQILHIKILFLWFHLITSVFSEESPTFENYAFKVGYGQNRIESSKYYQYLEIIKCLYTVILRHIGIFVTFQITHFE